MLESDSLRHGVSRTTLPPPAQPMTLSAFIHTHMEAILQEWEDFAATLSPLEGAGEVELRDHAASLLKVIALDLATHQAEQQSIDKSQGHGPQANQDTAAEIHAAHRVSSGFTGEQVMAEFRALRSSVLRLRARDRALTSAAEIEDMVRFNEALDQAQSESMARYTQMLREAQNLFLAILGHDVRTPLGAISMGAQVLLHDPALPAKALKVGVRILNSARRMDEIIRDLLDFSTTHLGDGLPIDPHNVDLGTVRHRGRGSPGLSPGSRTDPHHRGRIDRLLGQRAHGASLFQPDLECHRTRPSRQPGADIDRGRRRGTRVPGTE
ncbi:histidine kinase dimerization/phospho-acceptor domain-containing protein [Massilia jejuensis]|uniref:histidine kinase n=1 Tax=Massilia jejuensis TaxID=648894 RepID=A0ABW0PKB9_9BURK